MTFHSNSELYNKYDKTVRAVVNRLLLRRRLVALPIDREDLYQIGWVALIQCLPHYDKSRGVKFETYASRVIINAINTEMRQYANKNTSTLRSDVIGEECVDETTTSEMLREVILVARKNLDRSEREVFWKRVLDDKTFQEIADEIGFSRETARKIYIGSLEKIKEAVA